MEPWASLPLLTFCFVMRHFRLMRAGPRCRQSSIIGMSGLPRHPGAGDLPGNIAHRRADMALRLIQPEPGRIVL